METQAPYITPQVARAVDAPRTEADALRDRARLAFRNLLCRFRNIDKDQAEAAGVTFDELSWEYFRDEPLEFFLRTNDTNARALWSIVYRE